MAKVAIKINEQTYQVACQDGEEERLARLGDYVAGKIEDLAREVGYVGDARLLLLACLTLADELFEAREASGTADRPDAVRLLEEAAARIESMADSLESA